MGDLNRSYSMESFEGRLKRPAADSAFERGRENMFEGESGNRKRQRSESPLSRHSPPPSRQHLHHKPSSFRRSPSRSPVLPPNTRSPETRSRHLPPVQSGSTGESSSGLNASEYW